MHFECLLQGLCNDIWGVLFYFCFFFCYVTEDGFEILIYPGLPPPVLGLQTRDHCARHIPFIHLYSKTAEEALWKSFLSP